MSGYQIVSDFIQEMVNGSQENVSTVQINFENSVKDEERASLQSALVQAKVDLTIIETIQELFVNDQLTEKRILDRLKQLRGNNNG